MPRSATSGPETDGVALQDTGHRHRRSRGRRRGRAGRARLRDRRGARIALAVAVVFFSWVAWSMGHALTAPGGGTLSDRAAEWARDHYLGPLVTFGEWITYQPPKVGGTPSFALTAPGTAAAGHAQSKHSSPTQISPEIPAQLASPAGKPLPGEGVWRVLRKVHGVPAMFSTFLRPDRVHTSYVAGIVSMDQRLMRFQLHPGAEDPGPGNWRVPPMIPARSRRGLLATFNGGFKIATAGGGFYLHGVTKGTLQRGAASLVYFRDGRVAIGVWGRDVRMTKDVVGVRQNLRPIVDHGKIPASVNNNVLSSWGATLGGGYYVWRSGLGITATGRVIYVYGPALDVQTLAGLLKRAGAVEAMQLDINPEWMSFMYYRSSGHPADPAPFNLLPDQVQPASRFYSIASRDFTAAYAR